MDVRTYWINGRMNGCLDIVSGSCVELVPETPQSKFPDSKVLSSPDGPHVGPMNLAICEY